MPYWMSVLPLLCMPKFIPLIINAERHNHRNSAIFLVLLCFYSISHLLTSTQYHHIPLIESPHARHYMSMDYALIILFVFFSNEFHYLDTRKRDHTGMVVVLCISFLFSDVLLFQPTSQWIRLLHCLTQCMWRWTFLSLVKELQCDCYKK